MATELIHELRSRYGPFDGVEVTAILDIYWRPLYDPFWDGYHMPVRWR